MDAIEDAYAQYQRKEAELLVTLGDRILAEEGQDEDNPLPYRFYSYPDIDHGLIEDAIAISRLYADFAPQMYDAILDPSHSQHMGIEDILILAYIHQHKWLNDRQIMEIFQEAQRGSMGR